MLIFNLQDFESDLRLRNITIEFLQDLVCNPTLLPAENKAASQLLRLLTKEEQATSKVDLATLLSTPLVSHSYVLHNSCHINMDFDSTYLSYN